MPHKIALFLKTKHLGDSIILTSSIAALPSEFMVDIVCFKDSSSIFAMQPRVRNIYIVPRHLSGWAKIVSYWQILKALRASPYDLIAQFSDDWRGAWLTRLLKPKISVAREARKRPKFWSNSFQHIAKRAPTTRPAAEQDVDLLRKVKLFNQPIAPAYQLSVPDDVQNKVRHWLQAHLGDAFDTKKLILLHAAARWKFKGLPNETWAKLIDDLYKKGYQVILTGAPNDLETNTQISSLAMHKTVIADKFDLTMTAALMQRADLLVSIDSMSIHMASALQTPIVAIFGPTDEKIWGPWRVAHKVKSLSHLDASSFACRPCGLDGCAGSKISQCLVAIRHEGISDLVDELLVKTN